MIRASIFSALLVGASAVNHAKLATVQGDVIEGEYIVTLKPSCDLASALGDVSSLGALSKLKGLYGARAGSLFKGFTAQKISEKELSSILDMEDVLRVEPNQKAYAYATRSVTDAGYWGQDRVDQTDLPLDGFYVYKDSAGEGVSAFIVDTGIVPSHEQFGNRGVMEEEANFGSGIFWGDEKDCNGHGTHVGGTVGGKDAGLADKADIIGVKVLGCLGSGTFDGIISGIDYVASKSSGKVTTANLSLGGGFSQALNDAANSAVAAGVHMIIAAGNSGGDACSNSPASAKDVITVMASDVDDKIASFSDTGTCAHIIAPGVNIKSAWYTSNDAYNTISGTSMAAPHVAGVATILAGESPSLTPIQMRSSLTSLASADKISGDLLGGPNLLLYNDRD